MNVRVEVKWVPYSWWYYQLLCEQFSIMLFDIIPFMRKGLLMPAQVQYAAAWWWSISNI
jgi:hypothetical protein